MMQIIIVLAFATLAVNNNTVVSTNVTTNSSCFNFSQYDIVIDEIMADPSPQVQLPNYEWIELKNTSGYDINVQGWRVSDASATSGPMPWYVLKADSFLIVCSSGALNALLEKGAAIAVTSFPSLDNAGDIISLQSPDGAVVHAVNYAEDWYGNELKKAGGWSLEMTDTKNPCSGKGNWKASADATGGTPGKKNSADAYNPDLTGPKLLRAYAESPTNIVLFFDEPVDSAMAAMIGNYTISDGIVVSNVLPLAPLYDRVSITTTSPLPENKIYQVTVSSLNDCSGNALIAGANTARVGLAGKIVPFDIVVNEIMFNPKPASSDYVELYNRSKKILNLNDVFLANRSGSGMIGNITRLRTGNYSFFPGDFLLVTEDENAIKRDFITENPHSFLQQPIPSYNDDKGNVIILNEQGIVLDEIAYLDDWHFALISNKEGVALERISYDDTIIASPVQQRNWHSAASHTNYGTPGYKNSQYKPGDDLQGAITISPKIISPDNDGRDDFAKISYEFPSPGFVCNIIIFDAMGRTVRYLQRNALNGIRGYYTWDGLGEKKQVLSSGLYIIYTEIFNLEGKVKHFKNTIVLAGRR